MDALLSFDGVGVNEGWVIAQWCFGGVEVRAEKKKVVVAGSEVGDGAVAVREGRLLSGDGNTQSLDETERVVPTTILLE